MRCWLGFAILFCFDDPVGDRDVVGWNCFATGITRSFKHFFGDGAMMLEGASTRSTQHKPFGRCYSM
uniref:Putative secreted peptide n=1 Tax=Anopheles braziliensis TaxID=58242 RepID=A0A2M3ZWT0_9DIPT